MNFPDEPFFRAIHWLIDTPTVGGVIVLSIISLISIVFATTIYWIMLGAKADEEDVYVYPTPTLLGHNHSD